MKINDNQHYIYLRSTRERIPCTEQEFHDYYRDINAYRQKQQYHGKCVCPERKRLDCDMDCATCPFRRNGDLSLDYTPRDAEGNGRSWLEDTPDPLAVVDVDIEDQELVTALRAALSVMTLAEQEICRTIMDNLSERAAAAALNLSRNTYVYRRNKVLERLKISLQKFV